ncbi:hypothetical protein BGZ83_003238 [Gryganskiella cystojenkinii]|nr:hypothetical protein BGZ83_003238 [Gryganskiella cystojenkinii]
MTENHLSVGDFFQSTHARVDSKLHSDSSSEKVLDDSFVPLSRPFSSGLRRCAGTRDLTSIGSNVNYFAKVHVKYMLGDLSTPLETQSWKGLNAPGKTSDAVVVDNLETVRRFKKTLYSQLNPSFEEESDEECWPEFTLFRKNETCEAGLEPIEGDQEALYMFALKDGDSVVLLVHETAAMSATSRPNTMPDPVAQWVEAMRAQTEFESMET